MKLNQQLANQRQSWDAAQYELIDFGDGRKLERFGACLLDRPSPAAVVPRADPPQWRCADVRIDDRGQIVSGRVPTGDWQAMYGSVCFQLKLTPFGHLGLFPEQASNWRWLEQSVHARRHAERPLRALNLFAYTGGTSLVLAAAGVEVVHVDASAPAIAWARSNAQASGLDALPIRWITEDARKFAAREVRRGNRYDLVILDPPSYGHGPTGKRWEIEQHLPALLQDCASLVRDAVSPLVLLTAHSESPSMVEIAGMWREQLGALPLESGRLELRDRRARPLDAGFYIRIGSTRRS